MNAPRAIVLLHGFGSSPDDLMPLARHLGVASGLPVSTPEGPLSAGFGRAWFPLEGVTEANRPERIAEAMSATLGLVHAAIPTGTTLRDVVIGGFSQGAIMALSVFAAGHEFAGVLAFSGRLAAPPTGSLRSTPVVLAHGEEDRVIPADEARRTANWLTRAGLRPDLVIEAGLGHAVGPNGFQAANRMLERSLRVSP
ncbi:alpha/beta hydrolase [Jannaschia sp. 2305UL9-9]|uniref:alpha/beta hydrolase n=1 Tax=Jannaschia sp. 2305UL9-9 TaxID=3121638 RepID=UPI00352772BA